MRRGSVFKEPEVVPLVRKTNASASEQRSASGGHLQPRARHSGVRSSVPPPCCESLLGARKCGSEQTWGGEERRASCRGGRVSSYIRAYANSNI